MRKRSKIIEDKRLSLIDRERRMTPEQRLEAYVQHSRLVLEFYNAGMRDRASLNTPLRKQ